jgi:isoleucyl-tRNA synthetase
VSDWIHRALTSESVHLATFPDIQESLVNKDLEEGMVAVRALVSLGRAAREEVQIRVRQPLSTMYAVTPGNTVLEGELLALLQDELNVKEVNFLQSAGKLIGLSAKPNFRSLGPRFQKNSEAAAQAIRALPSEALSAFRQGGVVEIDIAGEKHPLNEDDLEVVEEGLDGLVVQSDGSFTAALDPALDDELRREGLARELVNRVQRLRKDSGLDITDRISLGVFGDEKVQQAASDFQDFITGEALARAFCTAGLGDEGDFQFTREVEIEGSSVRLSLSRLEA